MKNKLLEKIQNMWEKFRRNKRLQIILIISLLTIVILIYFSSFKNSSSKENTSNESNTASSYSAYLESKLKTALVNIDGVNNVSVIITLESGFEYVYATEEETKTTSTGTLTTSSLVLIDKKPVVVKELFPKIKGVVVITPSAKDINTRLNILSAIQTILEVSNDKITIIN